jgi:hypothetical protein
MVIGGQMGRFSNSVQQVFAAIIVMFSLSQSLASSEETIQYKDRLGKEWVRWVIIDELRDGLLLMVFEAPKDSLADESVSQDMVEKKFYSSSERLELMERKSFFLSLKDLDMRTLQFDLNRSSMSVKTVQPI